MELQVLELQDRSLPTSRRAEKLTSTPPSPVSSVFAVDEQPRPRSLSNASAVTNAASSLPPIDGGSRAWTFLFGAFLSELICLGGAFSFSIFQDYLVQNPTSPLHGKADNVGVSAIGTLLVCSSYFAPPFLRGVWSYYARWNRIMGFASLQLAGLSLFVASFGKSNGFLVIFMGLIPGIFLGLGTINYLVWLPQWFFKKRGLANGIAFAGAGFGGIIYPFVLSTALHQVGFQWTMRIWALIIVTLGGLASLLVRPRIRAQSQEQTNSASGNGRSKDQFKKLMHSLRYLASPLLLLNMFATFLASMSFFSVSFYLAVYCASLGLSSGTSTGIVAAFNAAALTGEIIIGHACDRFSYPKIMAGVGSMAALSAFLLFGLAQSLVGVVFFVLLYGMAAGSWCSIWTPSAFDVSRLYSMQTANVLLALTVPRGLASAIGPLVAAALYHPDSNTTKAIFGAFGFDGLIVFVGSCMAVIVPLAPVVAYVRKQSFLKVENPELLQERFM